jgi:hypothetical protein
MQNVHFEFPSASAQHTDNLGTAVYGLAAPHKRPVLLPTRKEDRQGRSLDLTSSSGTFRRHPSDKGRQAGTSRIPFTHVSAAFVLPPFYQVSKFSSPNERQTYRQKLDPQIETHDERAEHDVVRRCGRKSSGEGTRGAKQDSAVPGSRRGL